MNRLKLTIIVLLLNVLPTFGQEFIISKIIADKVTKEPLEYVNVNNDENNTISNQNGAFQFKSNIDLIDISSVGYESISTNFDELSKIDTIFLQPQLIELDELVIKDAASIVNEVRNNFWTNYPTDPYFENFFLRSTMKENGEICRLQDIFGKIGRNTLFVNQNSNQINYQVEIKNMRKADISDKKKVEYMSSYNINQLFGWYSAVFLKNSDYKFVNEVFSDENYFKVSFSKNNTNRDINTRTGYYIIDKNDYSLKQVNYKYSGDLNKLKFESKGPVKWRYLETHLFVNFIKNSKNSKTSIGSAKLTTIIEVLNEIEKTKDIYESTYDLVIVESFVKGLLENNLSVNKDLLKINYPYSEKFWENQNQLLLTNELNLFLQNIKNNKDLKSSYKIIGNF